MQSGAWCDRALNVYSIGAFKKIRDRGVDRFGLGLKSIHFLILDPLGHHPRMTIWVHSDAWCDRAVNVCSIWELNIRDRELDRYGFGWESIHFWIWLCISLFAFFALHSLLCILRRDHKMHTEFAD